MNYFISKQDCSIIGKEISNIDAGSKIVFDEIENKFSTIVDIESGNVVAINFYNLLYRKNNHKYCKLKNCKNDTYFIFDYVNENYNFCVDVFNENLYFEVTNKIYARYKESYLFIKKDKSVKFSHIEYFEKIAVLFFTGERNFVLIINKDEILFANYYDKISLNGENLTILTKLYDSLNHGKVTKIEKGKFESFLVYLDNHDLNLKEDFLPCVFLDCILAGNEKYLTYLLVDELKNQTQNLKEFFSDILDFYPISKTQCLVEKKDAKLDIFDFDISDGKISNITIVDY